MSKRLRTLTVDARPGARAATASALLPDVPRGPATTTASS